MVTKRHFGWIPDVPDIRDFRLSLTSRAIATAPKAVDLRPGMPPVWDQGSLGSCTAHAIGAVAEYVRRSKEGKKRAYMPSRLFLYYNERVAEGTVGEDAGAMIRTGIKSMNTQGSCVESLWPYRIGRFAAKPPATAYKRALVHQALKYSRVEQTLLAMRATLAQGIPFVFGFAVYESFESDGVAAGGIVPMPSISESMIGGHAVAAVGYSDAEKMFIVRNSWGSGWGQAGYFRMPYDYLLNNDLADDFWAIQSQE